MQALEEYLDTLSELGGIAPRLLKPELQDADLSMLSRWPSIEIRADLTEFFRRVPGYALEKVIREEARMPNAPFIIGEAGLVPFFSPVGIAYLAEEMEFRDVFFDPGDGSTANSYDYVGIGFVPFLTEHNGSFYFLNCDPASPTFGGVYQLYEGIGSVRVANDMPQFFSACHRLLLDGVHFVDEWGGLGVRAEDVGDAWVEATGLGTANGERDW